MKLTDLVRDVGGYPIRIDLVARVLEAADTVLKDRGGRNCHDDLAEADMQAILGEAGLKATA